jgi:O-phosphoseryl-tRNA(Cys) synthetase
MTHSPHLYTVVPGGQTRRRAIRGASLGLLLAATALAAGCATQNSRAPDSDEPIAVESVRLTAAGHYIDLRYRVLDPERARAVLGPTVKVRPRLVNEANGAVMAVPTTAKLGSLRQTQAPQKSGRTYFVMFVNSGGLETGSRVTAELGELRFKHLIVE